MSYKIGDKVVIRSWEDMEKQFGLDMDGDIKTRCCFVKRMKAHCGKKMTIDGITGEGNYTMKESCYIFSEDTFEKNHGRKIVITTNGEETLARLYEDGKVVKSATAKCSPEDEFDFNIGAKLAFDRLAESTAEKEEKYYNGKVVCVEKGAIFAFTVGKIYEFKDGKFVNDNGYLTPETPVKTLDEWNGRHTGRFAKLIPLVEETKGE